MKIGYCPIFGCNRGPGYRRAFSRSCSLLEHLRGVHKENIPARTKLRTWMIENGYDPAAYVQSRWKQNGVEWCRMGYLSLLSTLESRNFLYDTTEQITKKNMGAGLFAFSFICVVFHEGWWLLLSYDLRDIRISLALLFICFFASAILVLCLCLFFFSFLWFTTFSVAIIFYGGKKGASSPESHYVGRRELHADRCRCMHIARLFFSLFLCYSSFAREGGILFLWLFLFSFPGVSSPFLWILNWQSYGVDFHGYLFLGAPFYNIFDITCHRIAEYLRCCLNLLRTPLFFLLFPPEYLRR